MHFSRLRPIWHGGSRLENTLLDLKADSVRGVLFPAPGALSIDAMIAWEILFSGDSPDSFQKATAAPTLRSMASGERGGHNVTVVSQVGRIDITFNAIVQMPDHRSEPPRITDVAAALSRLQDSMKKIAGRVQAVRLAIVLETAATVDRGNDAALISQELPNLPVPADAIEISFQYNDRSTFQCAPEVAMNRIVSWSSGDVAFLDTTSGTMQLNQPMITSHFIGLKFDFNSAPESRVPASLVNVVIEELSSSIEMKFGERKAKATEQ